MKRFLCAFIALVLALSLCACSSGEKASISSGRQTGYDAALNDATERMYVYMLAKLREFNGFEPSFYRYDYDGDGTADWIVKYSGDPHEFWMFLPGGHMDTHIQILFNWGVGTLEISYSNANGRIYATNEFKDSVTTFCFDGQARDYCASVSRDFEFTESGLEYFNCKYFVEGNDSSEEAYTSYLQKLELLPIEQLSSFGYDELMPDITQSMMPDLAKNVSQFPFITNVIAGDSDGDGVDDYLFYTDFETVSDATNRPVGTTVTLYECGNEGQEQYVWPWEGATVFSLSSADRGELPVMYPYEADALAFKASVSSVDGAQKIVDAIVDTWTYADRAQLLIFGDDGNYYNELAQLGTWRPTSVNEITLDDGTVYTVSLSHDDNMDLDVLTLTSEGQTRKLFRGEYMNYRFTLIGTWESEDGETRITLYDDDTYLFEQFGFSSKGTWYFDAESITLVPSDPDDVLIGRPWQIKYRETTMYTYYNDGSDLALMKVS